jgi:hypothetical protein
MKKSFCFLGLIGMIIFSACVNSKQFASPFDKEELLGRDPSNETFIIKANGEKIVGTVITSSSKAYDARTIHNDWMQIDGKRVMEPDYYAFQNASGYHRYYRVTDLPYFISRLRFGKINLYYTVHAPLGVRENDVRGEFHTYIFEKEKDNLVQLNYKNFLAALSDNPAAANKFKELFPNEKVKRFDEKDNLANLLAVVELYNK